MRLNIRLISRFNKHNSICRTAAVWRNFFQLISSGHVTQLTLHKPKVSLRQIKILNETTILQANTIFNRHVYWLDAGYRTSKDISKEGLQSPFRLPEFWKHPNGARPYIVTSAH